MLVLLILRVNLPERSYFIENKTMYSFLAVALTNKITSITVIALPKSPCKILEMKNITGVSPLLLVFAFFANCARVAAIKLSWANSWTRRNHGMLLSVLSPERKSFPESSASSWTNTKCSAEEPRPGRNKGICESYPPSYPFTRPGSDTSYLE